MILYHTTTADRADRNEFLQRRVLIDFNLTEQALNNIVDRLRRGETVTMRAQRIAKEAKPVATHAQAGAQGGRGHKAIDNVRGFRGPERSIGQKPPSGISFRDRACRWMT